MSRLFPFKEENQIMKIENGEQKCNKIFLITEQKKPSMKGEISQRILNFKPKTNILFCQTFSSFHDYNICLQVA